MDTSVNKKRFKYSRGSITIEAAISFPVFMLLLLGMVVLIKVICIHMIINQAISETVKTISSSAYAISALNYMEDRAGEMFAMGHDESEPNLSLSIENLTGIISGDDGAASQILQDFAHKYLDVFLHKGWEYIYDNYLILRNDLETKAVDMLLREKLKGKPIKLNKLNIVFVKFPYSSVRAENMSHELDSYDADDVVITAEYRMDLPFSTFIGKNTVLRFSVVERGWVHGYNVEGLGILQRKSGKASDIWNQDPLKRGREFRKIFGSNLPGNFPTIDRFDSGKAVRIDSIDLRSETYKNDMVLTKTINGYISKLALYNGQPVAWRGKRILPGEIKQKELIIIVPLGTATQGQKIILETLQQKASSTGVNMKIIEY